MPADAATETVILPPINQLPEASTVRATLTFAKAYGVLIDCDVIVGVKSQALELYNSPVSI
jgi:hypothetical protein